MENRNQDKYGQTYGRDYEHPGYEDTGFGHDNSRDTRMPRKARPEMQGGYSRGGHGQGGQSNFSQGMFGQYQDHQQSVIPRHRGPAPKGYQRSDERLREIIAERLMEDPAVDASDVSITAVSGKVMLEGSVTQRRMKYLIEDVVEECGAKDVENRLQVRMEST